ncbi:MAG: hypothetical protein ABI718_04835 [Acidobacteriota bacterium]
MKEQGLAAPVVEQRQWPRYITVISISGIFGAADVAIRDIGPTGFQIEHAQRIPLRAERTLRFVYPRSFPPVYGTLGIPDRDRETNYAEFRCATVWSHLRNDTSDGMPAYRSGVTIQRGESTAALLPVVLRDFVRQDEQSLQRRRQLWREREVRRISRSQELADQILLVRTAVGHFRTHPAEAYPWYRRARYALSARNLPFEENPALGFTAEAVALWEFVGRSIPMRTIAHVLVEVEPDLSSSAEAVLPSHS